MTIITVLSTGPLQALLRLDYHASLMAGLAMLQFCVLVVQALLVLFVDVTSWGVFVPISTEMIIFGIAFTILLELHYGSTLLSDRRYGFSMLLFLNRTYLLASVAHTAANAYYISAGNNAPAFTGMFLVQLLCVGGSYFQDTYLDYRTNQLRAPPPVMMVTRTVEIPVAKIPFWTVQVVQEMPGMAADDDVFCGICYREFGEDECVRTVLSPCGHPFCSHCVKNLHSRRFSSCPLCRANVEQALEVRLSVEPSYGPSDTLSIRMSTSPRPEACPDDPPS